MATAKFILDAEDKTKGAFDSVKRSLSSVEGSAASLRNTLAAIGVGVSFAGVATGITSAIRAYEEADKSVKALQQTLKATGFAAGLTAKELEQSAQGLSKTSLFDDDAVREGIVSLLRFRTISKDVFKDATQAAVDFAAATGGTVASGATAIGRALQDPVGGAKALREVGIKLSDSQIELAKNLIETGQSAKAQRIILDELVKSIGGAASAQNTGLVGATTSLSKAFNDLQKAIGRSFDTSAVVAPINEITAAIRKLEAAGDSLPGFTEALKGIGSAGGTLGNLATLAKRAQDAATGANKSSRASGKVQTDDKLAADIGAVQAKIDGAESVVAERRKKRLEEQKKAQEEAFKEAIKQSQVLGAQVRAQADDQAAVAGVTNTVEIEKQTKRQADATALATQKAAELNDILAKTPSGQLREIEKELLVLNQALAGTGGYAKITAKEYEEAFQNIQDAQDRVFKRTQTDTPLGGLADSLKAQLKEMEFALQRWGKGFTETLARAVETGKLDFKSLANSIIADLLRMTIQKAITDRIFAGFAGSAFGKALFSADGNAFNGAGVMKFATGGVVNSPTMFRYGGGLGVMGEAGPEAVLPLKRGANGRLGVESNGGGSTIVVNIDSRADRSIIQSEVRRGVEQGLAAQSDLRRRGGGG